MTSVIAPLMLLGLLAAAWTVCERWLGGNSPTIDAGSDNSTDFPGRVIGEPDRSDELCNAYRDFKNRPMPPLRAATGDDGRREIVLRQGPRAALRRWGRWEGGTAFRR